MTATDSLPSAAPQRRRGLALLLFTILGYVGATLIDAAPWRSQHAAGEGWEALQRDGEKLTVDDANQGVTLGPGARIRLLDEETVEHRFTRIRCVLERLAETGFVDLRFRVVPNDAHELKLAPKNSFGVTLLHVPRDAPRVLLASVNDREPIPRMLTRFEVTLQFQDGRIRVAIDGSEVLNVADDRESNGAFELIARAGALRVHELDVEGTVAGVAYSRQDRMTEFEGASYLAPILHGLAIALLALALVVLWIHSTLDGARTLREILFGGGFGALPVAVVIGLGLFSGRLPDDLPLSIALLCGATIAFLQLRRGAPAPTASRSNWPRVALALGLLSFIGHAGASRELALFEPTRVQIRSVHQRPVPQPHQTPGTIVLDASNSLAVDAWYRDLDAKAKISLAPGAILEARIHGDRNDGVSLIVSAHATAKTRFVRATPTEFTTIGTTSGAVSTGRLQDLEISVRGATYRATLDGVEIASAEERLFPSGGVTFLAPRGRVITTDFTVTPVPTAARTDGAWSDALRGASRPLGLLLILAGLLALLLRRSLVSVVIGIGFAALPWSIALADAGAAAAPRALAIGTPVIFVLALLVDHFARARASTPLRINLALLLGIAAAVPLFQEMTRREWPPTESELNALSCLSADTPLAPDLLDFEHPLLRRWNFYLADHRFRKRTFSLAKSPGISRVLAVGTSSTYGYGTDEDWPTLLERELRSPSFGARKVEVLNGAYPGTASWRLLHFFKNVLLRFEPDVLVLSLYYNDSVGLSQFDEIAALDRLTQGRTGILDDFITRRAIDSGRRRFTALDLDFRAREFDALAAWDVPNLSPPPERFLAVIREFAQIARERGIALVLLQEPIAGDRRRVWKDEFRGVFRAVAEEFGGVAVDSTAAQLAGGGEKLFMDEVHPYVEGHRITARVLAPVVAEILDARKR